MTVKTIFVGHDGIRSGWRLLIFLSIQLAVIGGLGAVIGVLGAILVGAEFRLRSRVFAFPPLHVLLSEIFLAIALLVAVRTMARIERRRIGDYGWRPKRRGAPSRWGLGFLLGMLMVLAMYGLLRIEHAYSFGGWALSPETAVVDGLLWLSACFLVGFNEEGLYRGYAQFTLSRSIGFWKAAVLISLVFGLAHLGTFHTRLVIFSAASFGLLASFCLWRTGDLWLAMGVHTAFDFAEFFIFAPAQSFSGTTHLLAADLHGPVWLTGGTVGPEAGVNGYLVLPLAFAAVWLCTRKSNDSSTDRRADLDTVGDVVPR